LADNITLFAASLIAMVFVEKIKTQGSAELAQMPKGNGPHLWYSFITFQDRLFKD